MSCRRGDDGGKQRNRREVLLLSLSIFFFGEAVAAGAPKDGSTHPLKQLLQKVSRDNFSALNLAKHL